MAWLKIVVLGSTGSIGTQTLDVIRAFPDRFRVIGLSGGRNKGLLFEQIKEFSPKYWCSIDDGNISIEDMASLPEADIVVVATGGSAGLIPTVRAIEAGKKIALANKEVLVMAGEVVMGMARRRGAEIIPIDSELSAIWQCLRGEVRPKRIILTASGGPFRETPYEKLKDIKPEDALRHPTWRMGKKITIDSATLLNKGLEVMETRWLFDIPYDKIDVLIHPESIIHSLVEFEDGSLKAQLSFPDMRIPIQYALSYPERLENRKLSILDISKPISLNLLPLPEGKYPCFELSMKSALMGKTYPSVLVGADEKAVELFLEGKISFLDIPELIKEALKNHKPEELSIEKALEVEAWAKNFVSELVG